ncbi:endolytic transglycosylase MltG [Streptomyces sp. MAR4 CNX-425]|uniref:endolytic transglycosylase MltG n=1 Tax=Streptomyces sp. MAR4 CNX-425 TaxID=3406343 RepID=UPI003B50F611
MTDYGQNPGSQAWQPDDSLYGGQQDWSDGQPGTGHHHYGGQQPQQYYPQQSQAAWDQGQTPQYPGGWDTTGGMPLADPYAAPAPQPDYYGTPDAYPPPNPHPRRPQPHQQPGHQPPPGHQQQPPPHQQSPHQQQPPRRPQPGRPGPDGRRPREDWDPASAPPERDDHPFFDDGTPGDDDPDEPREGRRGGRSAGRNRRGAKRRNGCACFVVALVLAAGLGGLGYVGYNFWSDRFGAAPDYAGEGHGNVTVEIPEGASITQMGNLLKEKGVVKSVQAFIDAAGSEMLHPGSYSLHKEMSGEAAVELMLSPEAANQLVIPEGRRATAVYAMIDEHLGLKEDTTAKVAEKGGLGLPDWAEGNPEGFLWPSSYSAAEGTDPKKLLREMVKRANAKYTEIGLAEKADKTGMTPYEILTIASLIEAEGQSKEEFGKVSRVIYNRLKPDNTATNGMLQFDSTINYAKGESDLNISNQDTQFDSPYNTYLHAGLPPAPIDNPSERAINAALDPTEGDWLYFVTVEEGDTRFTASKEEHDRNVEEFNKKQREKGD